MEESNTWNRHRCSKGSNKYRKNSLDETSSIKPIVNGWHVGEIGAAVSNHHAIFDTGRGGALCGAGAGEDFTKNSKPKNVALFQFSRKKSQ